MKWKIPLVIFVVALLFNALAFVLVLGTPIPPGIILKVTESALKSHPGYSDLNSNTPPALDVIEQNIDSYNQYLWFLIIVLPLSIILCYAIFVACQTIIWNYISKKTFSLFRFWRVFFLELLLIFVTVPLGFLIYYLIYFIGTLLQKVHTVVSYTFVFACFLLAILCIIHLFTIIGYLSITLQQKRSIFVQMFSYSKREWLQLFCIYILGFISMWIIVGLVQFTTTDFIVLNYAFSVALLIPFTWIQCMVGENFRQQIQETSEQKSKKVKGKKK